jgi:photosystem II stability/assembly factor-like uncharacterized protein
MSKQNIGGNRVRSSAQAFRLLTVVLSMALAALGVVSFLMISVRGDSENQATEISRLPQARSVPSNEQFTFSRIDPVGNQCVMVYGRFSFGGAGFLLEDCGGARLENQWYYKNGYIKRMYFQSKSLAWFVIGQALVKVERSGDLMQGTVIRKEPEDDIEDVFFVDDHYGWFCGDNGKIYGTNDGGITWKRQKSNTGIVLRQIRFINTLDGWASGSENRQGKYQGVLVKTTDGGANWVEVGTQAGEDISPVFFTRSTHGCGVDGQDAIACTDDGYKWTVRHSEKRKNKRAISFPSEKQGWVVGDCIWHTSDGGEKWEKQYCLPTGESLNFENVVFVNDNLGWAQTLTAVWRTADGGKTWTRISVDWIIQLDRSLESTSGKGEFLIAY